MSDYLNNYLNTQCPSIIGDIENNKLKIPNVIDNTQIEIFDKYYIPTEMIIVRKYHLYKTQGVVTSDSKIESDKTRGN